MVSISRGSSFLNIITISLIVIPFASLVRGSTSDDLSSDRYATAFLNRTSFPAGFVFGTASSAYQYEGAANESGRGPSIWDTFTHKYPGKITDGSNGDVAIDSYYRYKESQKGLIGITLVAEWLIPNSTAQHDQVAAFRALDFIFGWYMDPLTNGNYPKSMRSLVGDRLPKFKKEQSKLLKGSFDFIGLNYYTSSYVSDAPQLVKVANASYMTDSLATMSPLRNGIPIGPKAASEDLYIYPRGIRDILLYTKRKYNNPLIYITENGVDEFNDPKLTLEKALADNQRIDYHFHHLYYLQESIKDGVNVKGYFAWSLLDNFEWTLGYTVRFGINYVDYKDGLKRYPKHSAIWFKNFLKSTKR